MRIGIVTATYTPSRNGVATSTSLFVDGLRRLGHTVRVFAPHHPKAVPAQGVIRLPALNVAGLPDYPLLLPVGPVASHMLPIMDFDILHTMHPFVAGHIAKSWAHRLGIPLVFTAHTMYHAYVGYSPTPAGLTARAVKQHVRAFAQQADVVLAPGQAMVEMLRAYGYEGPVELMPNPVDLARFRQPPDAGLRNRHGVPDGVPLLVYVGRMGAEKGLPMLLQAFASAQRAVPDLHLMMVGEGPLRASLTASAHPQVRWVGPVEHAKVADYLLAADLFVSASVSEVQPMTFLEAMAAATPVVAVDSAAARDLLRSGENGMLSAATAADLSEAILAALPTQRRAALSSAARSSAAAFDVEVGALALADSYARAEPRPRRSLWSMSPRRARVARGAGLRQP